MLTDTSVDTIDELEELSQNELDLSALKKKSVSGAASYFLRTIFLNIIGLAASLVLSWYFSPEDFAVYGYVLQFIGLLIFFSDIGLAASLIQKKERPSLTDYRTAFTIQQILAWLIFASTIVIAYTGLVENTVGPAGNWILLALGISFPLASLKTISSIKLERNLDFSKLVIPQILEQIVFNVILIFLAIKGVGVMAYAYAILFRSLVGTATMWLIKPWPIGLSFDYQAFKNLFHFGAKFQINDLLARIKDNLFFIILIRWVTPAQYGYISWAKTWSMYPYNLTVNNVMAITFPTFSRLQQHKEALAKAIEKSLFFITLAIFPLVAGMSIFIYPLTQVIGKYGKWEPAVFTFICLSVSIALAALSSPLVNTLNALGQINKTLKLMSMWTVLTWVITPLAIKYWGFNGVAIASLLIALTSVFPVYLVKKIIRLRVWEQIWRQLLFTLLMVAGGVMGINLWSRDIFYLLLGMIATGSIYLLAWLIFGRTKLFAEIKSLTSR